MARRSLLLLAVGLLTVVGCLPPDPPPPPPPTTAPPTTTPPTTTPPTTIPPRPTEVCGQSFSDAAAYQSAYDDLGHTDTGWVTADGFVPASLPDGRTAWWMSDTMTGTANGNNTVTNPGNVHNSIVVQNRTCLTPKFGSPAHINGTGNRLYWPGSAVIKDNTMAVFAYKVEPAPGPPGFDWKVLGTAVARFALPSLQLLSGPVDMPLNPDPSEPHSPVPWGIRSFLNPADGLVYLYGTTKHPIGPFGIASDAWLARAPFEQLTSLEYFTNPPLPLTPADSWSTDFANAKPMTFTKNMMGDGSPAAQLSVVPYGDRYLASAFAADVFQDDQGRSFVRAWEADSPQGPWKMVMNGTEPETIATFTKRSAHQLAYDARVAQLAGGAGWTAVYSVNDPEGQRNDFRLYRGEFSAPNGLPAP